MRERKDAEKESEPKRDRQCTKDTDVLEENKAVEGTTFACNHSHLFNWWVAVTGQLLKLQKCPNNPLMWHRKHALTHSRIKGIPEERPREDGTNSRSKRTTDPRSNAPGELFACDCGFSLLQQSSLAQFMSDQVSWQLMQSSCCLFFPHQAPWSRSPFGAPFSPTEVDATFLAE